LGNKQLSIDIQRKKQGRQEIRMDPTLKKGETPSLLNDKNNLLKLQGTKETTQALVDT